MGTHRLKIKYRNSIRFQTANATNAGKHFEENLESSGNFGAYNYRDTAGCDENDIPFGYGN